MWLGHVEHLGHSSVREARCRPNGVLDEDTRTNSKKEVGHHTPEKVG